MLKEEYRYKKSKIEEGYFIIKNQGLGTIEYGMRSAVSSSMLINTSKIYTAAGGINGDWVSYANLRSFEKANDGAGYNKDLVFWVKPNIYSDHQGLKSSVINYTSPEVYHFQLGLSYVPGQSNLMYSNLIGAALSYNYSISEDINYSMALTSEFAKGNLTNAGTYTNEEARNLRNELKHWNFGLNLKLYNLNCIFSYGNGSKSGIKLNPETKNMHYMNAGIAYHSDNRKLSLTYFTSGKEFIRTGEKKLSANELSAFAVSFEYL